MNWLISNETNDIIRRNVCATDGHLLGSVSVRRRHVHAPWEKHREIVSSTTARTLLKFNFSRISPQSCRAWHARPSTSGNRGKKIPVPPVSGPARPRTNVRAATCLDVSWRFDTDDSATSFIGPRSAVWVTLSDNDKRALEVSTNV